MNFESPLLCVFAPASFQTNNLKANSSKIAKICKYEGVWYLIDEKQKSYTSTLDLCSLRAEKEREGEREKEDRPLQSTIPIGDVSPDGKRTVSSARPVKLSTHLHTLEKKGQNNVVAGWQGRAARVCGQPSQRATARPEFSPTSTRFFFQGSDFFSVRHTTAAHYTPDVLRSIETQCFTGI